MCKQLLKMSQGHVKKIKGFLVIFLSIATLVFDDVFLYFFNVFNPNAISSSVLWLPLYRHAKMSISLQPGRTDRQTDDPNVGLTSLTDSEW